MCVTRRDSNGLIRIAIFTFALLLSPFHTQARDQPEGYFLQGYDIVSYFRPSGPILGLSKYSYRYNGQLHIFSSPQNMEDFKLSPAQYLPEYGGFCAYGMVYGMKSGVDPLQYDIIDGKLYLHIDGGMQKRWHRKIGRYIKKGDRAWKKLSEHEP